MHVLEVVCITQLETSPSNQQFIHSQERSQLNALPQCISVARQTGLSIGEFERQFGVYYREHVPYGISPNPDRCTNYRTAEARHRIRSQWCRRAKHRRCGTASGITRQLTYRVLRALLLVRQDENDQGLLQYCTRRWLGAARGSCQWWSMMEIVMEDGSVPVYRGLAVSRNPDTV